MRAVSQRMSDISKQTGLLFAWDNRVCQRATSNFEIGQVSGTPYSLFWVSCYEIPDNYVTLQKLCPVGQTLTILKNRTDEDSDPLKGGVIGGWGKTSCREL